MPAKKIVLVEDDRLLRQQLALSLSREYRVLEASDRIEAEELLKRESPELVLLDLNLPPSGKTQEGLRLIEQIKDSMDTLVVVMSGNTEMKTVLKAVEAGAHDFFKKPFDINELKLIVRRALEKREIERENARLREELQAKFSFQNIIGHSAPMLLVFEAIRRVAGSPATVFITGESGTGKDLIARSIHYNSPRSQHPFIGVNCAALPETLIESELFGYERGAFTGAVGSHPGRFELADRGTLFLDEIGSISPAVQAKLLRVLQDRCFERLGSTRKIQSDVRLIAATNEDLETKVREGTFREDLYYRIHVFPIHVPPLRERTEDIPLLLDHFLRVHCNQNQSPLKKIEPRALERLTRYPWKGNVRELENLVQTLVLMVDGNTIRVSHLPSYIQQAEPVAARALPQSGLNLEQAVEQYERDLIEAALRRENGVKTRAAQLLGIDKNRMKYLCRKYHL